MAVGHGEGRAIDEMDGGSTGSACERHVAERGGLVNHTDGIKVEALGGREQLRWRNRALQEVIPGRDGRERIAEGDVRADRAVRLPQRGVVRSFAWHLSDPIGPCGKEL